MIRILQISFLLIFITKELIGQSAFVEGKIVSRTNREPIPGVIISFKNLSDTTEKFYTQTDVNGHFAVSDLRQNKKYIIEGIHIAYRPIRRTFATDNPYIYLGTFIMSDTTIPMSEVVIEGRIPAVEQKGDTTEYTAKAYKTNPDASAEDLVTKMPGVTVEGGTVKAQGEQVEQVLVDGRQFFGNDPTVALRNLPAEVIEKVQVFDKLSDQAKLTGFDDGQSIKTMNIVTRPERRQGEFGRLNAGYGTDDRYVTTGNLNFFRENHRLSLIGLTNNINQQNFSMQDLLGVMSDGGQRGGSFGGGMFLRGGGRREGGRPPGGGMMVGGGRSANNFMVGEQSGISTTHSAGFNYSGKIANQSELTGSYFFNYTNNTNPRDLSREYMLSADSSSYYNENSDTEQKNYNHRFNLRLESDIDSSNSIIFTPRIYLQNNKSINSVNAVYLTQSDLLLSQSLNNNQTRTNGYTLQSDLVFRHKFQKLGRTISIETGVRNNRKESDRALNSYNTYYDEYSSITDTTDQKSDILTNNLSLSSNLMYTEPISSSAMIQVNYEYNFTKNKSYNDTYNYDQITGAYTNLDSLLSNLYENQYITHNPGIGYRFRSETGINATARISYQVATLKGEQYFPLSSKITKNFYSILPSLMFNYEFSRRQNLRLNYRTSTISPDVTQLQNVVDNTNPLLLSTGNPELKQSYTHTAQARLTLSNTETARSLLFFLHFNYTNDYIGNSTIIATRDTVLFNSISLNKGSQLTYPVNLDNNWSIRSFFTYGFPFDYLKSNLNINAGISYSRTPGLINNVTNRADVYALSPGFVLGSNISEKIDFTISYSANFNFSKNSVQKELDNNYYTHNAGFKFNWIFWKGIVFRNEMSNTLYEGLGEDLDQNIIIWNISLGKKLFENDRGEITLTVYDVLNKNKSIRRNVTETYIEDLRTRTLTRFLLLTFTYNLRQFQERRPEFN